MIAWDPAFISEHESAWGLLQKLSWLNEASPINVIKAACGLALPLGDAPHFRRALRNTDWLNFFASKNPDSEGIDGAPMAFKSLPRALIARGGLAQWGDMASFALSATVRYCEICLARGYHAVAHQLLALRRCPRHGTPMRDHCRHCGAVMPAFAVRQVPRSFACACCHHTWLGNTVRPDSSRERQRNDATCGEIRRWAQRVLALPYPWQEWFDVDMSGLCLAADRHGRSLVDARQAMIWLVHDIHPFPLPTRCLHPRPLGLSAHHAQPRRPPGIADAGLGRSVTRAKLAWEVDRYIRRQWLAAHRECLQQASFLVIYHHEPDLANLAPGLCPLAHALALWRIRLRAVLFSFSWRESWGDRRLDDVQMDALCAQWLNQFHFAVHCSVQALRGYATRTPGEPPRYARWLSASMDPWAGGRLCLKSTDPTRDPRPIVAQLRMALASIPADCTVPHWPHGEGCRRATPIGHRHAWSRARWDPTSGEVRFPTVCLPYGDAMKPASSA